MATANEEGLQVKSIISTVIKRCTAEKLNSKLLIPIDDVPERVAFYTGISKTYIAKLSEGQTVSSGYWCSNLQMIKRCLQLFYSNKKLPTLYEVYCHLEKEEVILPPLAQFTQELSDLGYCYRKTTKGYLLMEDPILTFERFNYLKKIIKYRQNKNINYMDERIIDESCTFPKPTEDMIDKTMSDSLLFCYLVSHTEVVMEMFCNCINRNEIINWLKLVVIPSLKPSSVVVMSNNFLYGLETNKPPSPYASKDSMLKWLRFNNIPCNNNMRKPELYTLITRFPHTGESHDIDMLFKAYGHEVLRLPTSLQDLTPTERALHDMKLDLKDKGIPNLFNLKEYVNNYIKTELCLMHKWSQYIRDTHEIENQVFALDESMESLLDSYDFEIDDPLFKCMISVDMD